MNFSTAQFRWIALYWSSFFIQTTIFIKILKKVCFRLHENSSLLLLQKTAFREWASEDAVSAEHIKNEKEKTRNNNLNR